VDRKAIRTKSSENDSVLLWRGGRTAENLRPKREAIYHYQEWFQLWEHFFSGTCRAFPESILRSKRAVIQRPAPSSFFEPVVARVAQGILNPASDVQDHHGLQKCCSLVEFSHLLRWQNGVRAHRDPSMTKIAIGAKRRAGILARFLSREGTRGCGRTYGPLRRLGGSPRSQNEHLGVPCAAIRHHTSSVFRHEKVPTVVPRFLEKVPTMVPDNLRRSAPLCANLRRIARICAELRFETRRTFALTGDPWRACATLLTNFQ
jgi:hypothetical protein